MIRYIAVILSQLLRQMPSLVLGWDRDWHRRLWLFKIKEHITDWNYHQDESLVFPRAGSPHTDTLCNVCAMLWKLENAFGGIASASGVRYMWETCLQEESKKEEWVSVTAVWPQVLIINPLNSVTYSHNGLLLLLLLLLFYSNTLQGAGVENLWAVLHIPLNMYELRGIRPTMESTRPVTN